MSRGQGGVGVCAGQRRLEAYFWKALTEYSHEVQEDESVAVTARGWEWRAVAGGGCLHLALDPVAFTYLMVVLPPLLYGPVKKAELSGCPGLRLTHTSTKRIELRSWDGHGRLVLLPDADGLHEWMVAEEDNSAEYTICTEGCSLHACSLADVSGHPLQHPLRHHPGLHPAEHTALLRPADAAGENRASMELRAALATLPAPADTTHELTLTAPSSGGTAVIPVAPLGGRLPSSFPRELLPAHFESARLDDPRTADLGDALARQLLRLLADKRAYPGDVLGDTMAIITRIGGRGPAARWAQLALHHVAHRYGLLRYRPRQPGEPAHLRPHVWAVSEAALTMAPLAWRSLGISAL
ncbi:hypothetical protein [Streptomyces sp. NPDC058861]|uniref:hypothetical protein n=1 Tax=Streptomyces sp. NPDC058861 TaxID=3346653 RepID=UPI003687DE18